MSLFDRAKEKIEEGVKKVFARGKDVRGGIDWSVYGPEGLDMIFLGWVYRTKHSAGDRRAQGEQPWEVDPQTGVPKSEAGLTPAGAAIPGYQLALSTAHYPDKWAGNLLLREDPQDKTIGEALWRIPRDKWTQQEAENVAELTLRWKHWAAKAAERGWVKVEPPLAWNDEFKNGIGADGLPWVWHATAEALCVADEKIPGTVQARGASNALATASKEDREHAAREVPWYAKRFKNDQGSGS